MSDPSVQPESTPAERLRSPAHLAAVGAEFLAGRAAFGRFAAALLAAAADVPSFVIDPPAEGGLVEFAFAGRRFRLRHRFGLCAGHGCRPIHMLNLYAEGGGPVSSAQPRGEWERPWLDGPAVHFDAAGVLEAGTNPPALAGLTMASDPLGVVAALLAGEPAARFD